MPDPYSVGLEKNPANFVPLSPLSFIERSAFIYPKRISVIQGIPESKQGPAITSLRKSRCLLNTMCRYMAKCSA